MATSSKDIETLWNRYSNEDYTCKCRFTGKFGELPVG